MEQTPAAVVEPVAFFEGAFLEQIEKTLDLGPDIIRGANDCCNDAGTLGSPHFSVQLSTLLAVERFEVFIKGVRKFDDGTNFDEDLIEMITPVLQRWREGSIGWGTLRGYYKDQARAGDPADNPGGSESSLATLAQHGRP